ncbi:Dysbindin-A [Acipenser ruthenus]|uniref:Dysbindin-A n=1 Tax=Acipenser ruthenus TaxID=7906 RepID=A0A662YZ45_ACIRT|nr:Dysbindin-A [Acipenser ruthenus]
MPKRTCLRLLWDSTSKKVLYYFAITINGLQSKNKWNELGAVSGPNQTTDAVLLTSSGFLSRPAEVRYEDTWVTLHKRAKESAIAGEAVDEEVVMLSAHWEKRRNGLLELQEQLQQIPAFLLHLESITSKISHLAADFEELEGHLMHLEDLCGQCEMQRYKQFQMQQVENYKKKKRKELETLKAC